MKKIAVDLRILDTPSGKRGIGYYTFNQFQALENITHPDLEFTYFTFLGGKHGRELNLNKSSKFWDIPSSYRPARGIRRLDPIFAHFWRRAISKIKPDIIHISSLFDTIYVEIPKDIPSVVTFYDLIPYLNLEKYFGNEKARSWYRNRLAQLDYAVKIIAISKNVKKDLIDKVGIPEKKIEVIYGGFDNRFKVLDKQRSKEEILKKYKIHNKFILAQPAFSAHKNVERIFKSYHQFIKQNRENLDLVVVCRLTPKEEQIWKNQLQALGIKDRVCLTNFVPDEDMPLFYNAAELLLYPSLYEGFGLPILEAMACGCPVITSNLSSMPEAGGSAAVYVDPQDEEQITQALIEITTNQSLKKILIEKGFTQSQKFNWQSCAEKTLALYQQILKAK